MKKQKIKIQNCAIKIQISQILNSFTEIGKFKIKKGQIATLKSKIQKSKSQNLTLKPKFKTAQSKLKNTKHKN